MISDTLTTALIDQFNRERLNEAVYSALSDVLDLAAWPGASHWMRTQSAEEGLHARKLAEYLTDQNRLAVYQPLPAPLLDDGITALANDRTGGLLAVCFRRAMALEKQTTAEIDELYHMADIDESPATHELLLWFVREQVEEERQLVDILQELDRADCSAARLILDKKYGER